MRPTATGIKFQHGTTAVVLHYRVVMCHLQPYLPSAFAARVQIILPTSTFSVTPYVRLPVPVHHHRTPPPPPTGEQCASPPQLDAMGAHKCRRARVVSSRCRRSRSSCRRHRKGHNAADTYAEPWQVPPAAPSGGP